MSIPEILVWLSEVQLPGLRAIWEWLMIVPWWLAIGSVVFSYMAIRVVLVFSWNMYVKACDKSAQLGGLFGKWAYQARIHFMRAKNMGKRIAHTFKSYYR